MTTGERRAAKALFVAVEPWEQAYLERQLPEVEAVFVDGPLTAERCRQAHGVTILSVFVWDRVDGAVLDGLPDVRLITTRSTGYDHIDLAACRDRHVVVANVPTYAENTVAEHTFGLILALTRRIPQAIDRTRRGDFSLQGLRGFDLKGRTLGVVGVGSIGRHVARIGRGFDMNVVAFDPWPDAALATAVGFRWAGLEEVLAGADIVTLHCPLTPQTHHLLNAERLAMMKPGSYLINTARGAVVDHEALARALAAGHLAGAGLDVLEEEGLIKDETRLLSQGLDRNRLETLLCDHLLLNMPNVVVTPHNAFNTQEALGRILDATVTNIRSFLQGQPRHVVA